MAFFGLGSQRWHEIAYGTSASPFRNAHIGGESFPQCTLRFCGALMAGQSAKKEYV
jgi:hypothetical protein